MPSPDLSPIYPEQHPFSPVENDQEPFEYRLLTGHARTDGSWKSSEELRTEYVRRTDELIRLMTEGVEVADPMTGERSVKIPDAVVYLDKSARPVEWLVRELWPKLASRPGEPLPKRPDSFFVNIDREQWVNTIDPEGKGTVDIDRVDPSIIRSLRSIFVPGQYKIDPKTGKDKLSENIDNAPASLDGKTVLIVDEVLSSGRTLNYATKFFNRAFPTAQVTGSYWMSGVAQRGTGTGNADLPVWYKEKTHLGRGVGNRNENASRVSNSRTQRLGAWFLSTRLGEKDPDSVRLREEIHHLAHDDEVLLEPSRNRQDEDYDERVSRFNKGIDLKTFVRMRHAQEGKK